VTVQEAAVSRLFDAALELAVSSRPQDGSTAAYIFRFLLRLPSFSHILVTHDNATDAAATTEDDNDCYYRYSSPHLCYLFKLISLSSA